MDYLISELNGTMKVSKSKKVKNNNCSFEITIESGSVLEERRWGLAHSIGHL